MPFGFGLRRCPGEKLAWVQIKTLVVKVLKQFEIQPHDSESKKAAENTAEAFVLWAKDDIELQIKPRD